MEPASLKYVDQGMCTQILKFWQSNCREANLKATCGVSNLKFRVVRPQIKGEFALVVYQKKATT